ncbi:MAG: hypothetical protein H0S78_13925 [Tissierellales bacterium]|jgi:hypothetical protein|nr:hypothetical protein [Tissierellales bacterium]HCX04258.1 hypothetical protein [Clostridiales bacterium]
MDFLYEKIAYLNGLLDGMDIDKNGSKEGKALLLVSEILEDIVSIVEDLDVDQEEMEDYVSAIDEDLSSIENEIFDELDDDLDDLDDIEIIEE